MALMQSPVLGRLSPYVNPKLSPETVTLMEPSSWRMEHFIIWQNINPSGTINDTGNHPMILLIRPAYTFGSEERVKAHVTWLRLHVLSFFEPKGSSSLFRRNPYQTSRPFL